jgi:uncharacterized protein (TIGR02231 family)
MWKRVTVSLTACGLAVLLVLAARGVLADPPARERPPAPPGPAAKETAPVGAKMAASRVVGVTVYSSSALVTREVEVPEGRGTVELTVTPLPPATVAGSLYAEGAEGVRVLATRLRTRPVLEDTREDVRKLQDEIRTLQQTQEKAEADVKAAQAQLQFMGKLENFTAASTVHATEKGKMDSDATIALAKYIGEGRGERTRELVALQQSIQTLVEKVEFARRKLGELTPSLSRTERDAILVLEKTNGAAGSVRLNYLVDEASWRPQYKLRAGRAARDPVQLEYLAAVAQHTGEDWANVQLVLSTAQPSLNAAPPELQTLQVAAVPGGNPQAAAQAGDRDLQEQVRELRAKAQKDFNANKHVTAVGLCNTAAALDQSWELLNPEAAVRRGCAQTVREGPSVAYPIDSRLTVPSRTDEQVLEVARVSLAPDYYYKAVPVLTAHVYRLADLANRSKYVLLPGEATMYIGSDFVGQMNLPLVAVGESFTAAFGVDPQLQVQRQMIDRARTTQGSNQVLRYEYRIQVASYKPEPVRVQVWDRLPHSDTDTVGVNLLRSSPEVCQDPGYVREQRPTNLLRWDVNVEPGMTGEKSLAIRYEFKLELDRQMSISSFRNTTLARAEEPAAAAPLPTLTAEDAAKVRAALARLSPEDRALAEAQVFCAIDQDTPLGMTGAPQKVMVKGRPVFVCCKGCAAEARAHPDEALASLDKLMARVRAGSARR